MKQWKYLKVLKGDNYKNCEYVSQLKIAEIVLEHVNLVNNQYQQDLRNINSFTLNKSFGKLAEYLPSLFIFLNTFSS